MNNSTKEFQTETLTQVSIKNVRVQTLCTKNPSCELKTKYDVYVCVISVMCEPKQTNGDLPIQLP
jgi:hypothetical protein